MKPGSVKQLRSHRAVRRAVRAFRRANPVCQRCGVRAAVETHHRVPLHEAPELAAEWSNLEALCRSCHESHHEHAGGRGDRGAGGPPPYGGRNGAGWPTTGGGAQVCVRISSNQDNTNATPDAATAPRNESSRRTRVPVNDRNLWRLS